MKTVLASLLFAILPVAAADFPGTWNVSTQNENGEPIKTVLILKEEGGVLSAVMQGGERKIPVSKLQRQGDQISFQIPYNDITVTIKLTLQGDTLKGNWSVESGETGPVTAQRAAAASPAGKWQVTATMSDGNPMIFFMRPICLGLLIAALLLLIVSLRLMRVTEEKVKS